MIYRRHPEAPGGRCKPAAASCDRRSRNNGQLATDRLRLVGFPRRCAERLRHFVHRRRFLLFSSWRELHATAEHGAIFYADTGADHVSGKQAFAADVHAVAALDVAGDLAHDHNFTRGNVGLDGPIAANGHAMVFEAERAFDAAVNVKRLAAGDFTFDHNRATDGRLLDGRSDSLDWRVEG